MPNDKIKFFLRGTGVRQYELAELLGCSEGVLSKIFRKELPEAVQDGMIDVVKAHISGKEIDTDFFQEFMIHRYMLGQAKKNDLTRARYDAILRQRMLDKALDDMEKRRIECGWDTIQGGWK